MALERAVLESYRAKGRALRPVLELLELKLEVHRDNPDIVSVLKEVGRVALEQLPAGMAWAWPYRRMFAVTSPEAKKTA
jgi:hypothetical protein